MQLVEVDVVGVGSGGSYLDCFVEKKKIHNLGLVGSGGEFRSLDSVTSEVF